MHYFRHMFACLFVFHKHSVKATIVAHNMKMKKVFAERGKVLNWGPEKYDLKSVENGSYFEKLIWVLAFVVASGLCGFQLYTTLNRYFDKPIVTYVKIDKFNTFKIPKFVICPTFYKSLDQDEDDYEDDDDEEDEDVVGNCFPTVEDRLKNEVERICGKNVGECSVPLHTLNISLADIWNESQINKISYNPKCGLAVNRSECSENKKNNISLTQNMTERATLLGGNCVIVSQADEFYYNQRSKGLKLQVTNVDENYPVFAIDFYDNLKSVVFDIPFQSMFITYDYSVKIHSVRKFIHLNTYSNPCVTDEEARNCNHVSIEQQLEARKFCHLPMLNASLHPTKCSKWNDVVSNINKLTKWFLEENLSECNRSCEENMISFSVKRKRLNSSIYEIEIEFVNNIVEEIRQEYAYSLNGMLSDVAGNLGFFLGVSLMNVVRAPIIFLKKKLF